MHASCTVLLSSQSTAGLVGSGARRPSHCGRAAQTIGGESCHSRGCRQHSSVHGTLLLPTRAAADAADAAIKAGVDRGLSAFRPTQKWKASLTINKIEKSSSWAAGPLQQGTCIHSPPGQTRAGSQSWSPAAGAAPGPAPAAWSTAAGKTKQGGQVGNKALVEQTDRAGAAPGPRPSSCVPNAAAAAGPAWMLGKGKPQINATRPSAARPVPLNFPRPSPLRYSSAPVETRGEGAGRGEHAQLGSRVGPVCAPQASQPATGPATGACPAATGAPPRRLPACSRNSCAAGCTQSRACPPAVNLPPLWNPPLPPHEG